MHDVSIFNAQKLCSYVHLYRNVWGIAYIPHVLCVLALCYIRELSSLWQAPSDEIDIRFHKRKAGIYPAFLPLLGFSLIG